MKNDNKKSDDIDTKKLDELGDGLFVGTPEGEKIVIDFDLIKAIEYANKYNSNMVTEEIKEMFRKK